MGRGVHDDGRPQRRLQRRRLSDPENPTPAGTERILSAGDRNSVGCRPCAGRNIGDCACPGTINCGTATRRSGLIQSAPERGCTPRRSAIGPHLPEPHHGELPAARRHLRPHQGRVHQRPVTRQKQDGSSRSVHSKPSPAGTHSSSTNALAKPPTPSDGALVSVVALSLQWGRIWV